MILLVRYLTYVTCIIYLLTLNTARASSSTSVSPTEVGETLGLGDILLNVFGRPFAPTSPQNVTSLCRAHSALYLQAFDTFAPWALNMYDASTKIPSGIITGNVVQLGNYEQCVNLVPGALTPTGSFATGRQRQFDPGFRGQHCTASIRFVIYGLPPAQRTNTPESGPSDMRELFVNVAEAADMHNWTGPTTTLYQWAFCVPSSCTAADVEVALGEKLRPLNRPGSVVTIVKVNSDQCLTSDDNHRALEAADWAIICVFAIFALLLVCSTTYDLLLQRKMLSKYNNKRRDDVLVSFSLYTNGRNLVDTHSSKETLQCLIGIRFLTICWVIFSHTFYMNAVAPDINRADMQYLRFDWTKMVVMNGTLATDTFFFLSGVLLTYVFLKQMTRRPYFNLAKFYIHRYVRLTPALAITVFFYATLFYHLGSGPLWNTWVGTDRDNCVENWWSSLLYVNNYVDLGRTCMGHTWYLSMDMQFFWLSPLIIYPLWRWPRVGQVVLGAALVASIITPFAITFCLRLAGAMLYATDMTMVAEVFVYVYTRTYNRGGPYLIGIALGYILHTTKNKPVVMSKIVVALGWLASTVLCLVTLFGIYPMYQPGHDYNVLEASSYAALHRSVWALGLAWVVFACVHGYGGIVNGILSWKLFLPLSRVSYSAYLCHNIVLHYNAGTARTPQFFSTYNIVRDFLSVVLITLFLATIITLTFEVPFMALDRVLMSREVVDDGKQADDPGSKTSLELSAKAKEIQDNLSHSNLISVTCTELSCGYGENIHTLDSNAFDNAAFDIDRFNHRVPIPNRT